MFEFEIGGNEIKPEASEGINDIAFNRSLLALQLTDKEPISPEFVYKLKTVEEVFGQFKPSVEVEFENEEGAPVKETLQFGSVADFKPKSISTQSTYLRSLDGQYNEYTQINRRLKGHRVLQTVLENPETKAAMVEMLKALAQELEENE
jgi:predicted component of type VI protein secretion system